MALRFGLLGTGHWAQEAHGAALAAHDQAELTGVWGRNPSKAAAVAERFGVRAFHDLDALLEAVDAVAIAVPPDVQAELAVRAATAGRHLLLDKPLALSTDAARRVVEAVAANGVASLLFFTSRYHPEVAAWLDQVREAGDWHGAYAAWLGSIYHPGSPYAESPWRRSKGALWDVGPHALALALPTLGPVERVTAGGGLGDTVHLVLGHGGRDDGAPLRRPLRRRGGGRARRRPAVPRHPSRRPHRPGHHLTEHARPTGPGAGTRVGAVRRGGGPAIRSRR